jgi:hypothetical protein
MPSADQTPAQTPTPLVASPERIRARLAELSAEARVLRAALRAAEGMERLRAQKGGPQRVA